MEWIFRPLDSSFDKDAFDCGVPKLNEYLKQYAAQNDKKGIAKTFVAILEENSNQICCYLHRTPKKISGSIRLASLGFLLKKIAPPSKITTGGFWARGLKALILE